MAANESSHPADEAIHRMGESSFPGVENLREIVHNFDRPDVVRAVAAIALCAAVTVPIAIHGRVREWLNR